MARVYVVISAASRTTAGDALRNSIPPILTLTRVQFGCRKHGLGYFFFFSSRRRHTRFACDWSSDVCSSDLVELELGGLDAFEVHDWDVAADNGRELNEPHLLHLFRL